MRASDNQGGAGLLCHPRLLDEGTWIPHTAQGWVDGAGLRPVGEGGDAGGRAARICRREVAARTERGTSPSCAEQRRPRTGRRSPERVRGPERRVARAAVSREGARRAGRDERGTRVRRARAPSRRGARARKVRVCQPGPGAQRESVHRQGPSRLVSGCLLLIQAQQGGCEDEGRGSVRACPVWARGEAHGVAWCAARGRRAIGVTMTWCESSAGTSSARPIELGKVVVTRPYTRWGRRTARARGGWTAQGVANLGLASSVASVDGGSDEAWRGTHTEHVQNGASQHCPACSRHAPAVCWNPRIVVVLWGCLQPEEGGPGGTPPHLRWIRRLHRSRACARSLRAGGLEVSVYVAKGTEGSRGFVRGRRPQRPDRGKNKGKQARARGDGRRAGSLRRDDVVT